MDSAFAARFSRAEGAKNIKFQRLKPVLLGVDVGYSLSWQTPPSIRGWKPI